MATHGTAQRADRTGSRTTGYDRRMYAIMNNPAARRMWSTRSRRRVLFGAHAVLTAGFAAAWLATVFASARWAMWLMVALVLPWSLTTGSINEPTRGSWRPEAETARQPFRTGCSVRGAPCTPFHARPSSVTAPPSLPNKTPPTPAYLSQNRDSSHLP